MNHLQALVVDYGGVLTTPLQEAMVAFAAEIGLDLQDFVRVALAPYTGGEDSLVTDFETGRIGENEFSIAFAERLSAVAGKEVPPENLVARLFGGVSLESSMLELVERVRATGRRTALLSNSWGLDFYPRDRFSQIFDVVLISGEVGLRKPDPALFELLLERLGLPGKACLFVDDHPGHLDAARGHEIETLLHTSPETTIPKVEEMLGLGVPPTGS